MLIDMNTMTVLHLYGLVKSYQLQYPCPVDAKEI